MQVRKRVKASLEERDLPWNISARLEGSLRAKRSLFMCQWGKVVPRGAKGLLTARELEAVGAAPNPDHLQHGLDFTALFILELLQLTKSL